MSDCTYLEQGTDPVIIESTPDCPVLEHDCSTIILESCKQGPTGPSGMGNQQDTVIVAPTDTEVIDSLAVATYTASAWLVHLTTVEGTPRYRGLRTYGVQNGTTSFYNVYGNIGENVLASVVVDLNGANLELQVTNNDAVDIEVRVLQFPISTTP